MPSRSGGLGGLAALRARLLLAALLCATADGRTFHGRPLPLPVDPSVVWSWNVSSVAAAATAPGLAGETALGHGSRRRRRAVSLEALQGLAALSAEAEKLGSIASQSLAMLEDTGVSFDDIELDDGGLLLREEHEAGRLGDGAAAAAGDRAQPRSPLPPSSERSSGGPAALVQRAAAAGDKVQLEMRLAGVSLKQLHDTSKESVAEFLLLLQACLDRGPHFEVRVATLSERFRLDTSGGEQVKRNPVVVVKLTARQLDEGSAGPLSAQEMGGALLTQLEEDQQCHLASSSFSFAVKQASIEPALPPTPRQPLRDRFTSKQALREMALPAAMSVMFAGVLLWLAAT